MMTILYVPLNEAFYHRFSVSSSGTTEDTIPFLLPVFKESIRVSFLYFVQTSMETHKTSTELDPGRNYMEKHGEANCSWAESGLSTPRSFANGM